MKFRHNPSPLDSHTSRNLDYYRAKQANRENGDSQGGECIHVIRPRCLGRQERNWRNYVHGQAGLYTLTNPHHFSEEVQSL